VAGYTALGVTLTERSPSDRFRITTFLAIDTGDATAQIFLLQAPAVGYYEVEGLLLTTIQARS
jgi:hypothetical protein